MEMDWPQTKDPSIRKTAKNNKTVNEKALFSMALIPPSFHCMRNSGFFGFYIQLSFGTIQNLPKNLLAVPLEAFSGEFPFCLIGTTCTSSQACEQFFLKNPMLDARTAFRANERAKQRPRA
jgi:hypothetical protein